MQTHLINSGRVKWRDKSDILRLSDFSRTPGPNFNYLTATDRHVLSISVTLRKARKNLPECRGNSNIPHIVYGFSPVRSIVRNERVLNRRHSKPSPNRNTNLLVVKVITKVAISPPLRAQDMHAPPFNLLMSTVLALAQSDVNLPIY
jgi:hypothetical protein